MTPTRIRNGVVLALTLLGVVLIVVATREDPQGSLTIAGLGCFLLAGVYAQLTKPRGRE